MTTQPKRRRRTPAEMEKVRRRREAARKRNLRVRHRMTVEQYDDLLDFQGGVCYICLRARGATRKLAVDHNHAIAREACTHDPNESCINCWRGLLCARCNDMLGHARDDVMVFWRAQDYLSHPPARRWHKQPLKQMRTTEWLKSQLQQSSSTTELTSPESPSTAGGRSAARSRRTTRATTSARRAG